jgi:hypothetical protein
MAFDPITAGLQLGEKLIDRLLPDKAANDAAKAALVQMQLNGELAEVQGQIQTNIAEAANAHVFVSGWRPYIGWICGTGLGYEFLLRPLLTFGAGLFHFTTVAPNIDMGDLIILLTGMLGFGAMRSFDKSNGTDSGH